MPKPTTTPTDQPLPVLREIEGKQLARALAFDLETLDKESRTVEVAVSSEYPVRRWFGMEVLDHSDSAIDLTRLRNGAPFLLQHNSWSGQIGVVDDAWLDTDRRLRARIRFSRSERAEEIWQDVIDGIRQNISVGYIPLEMVLERSDENLDHYRVTRWEPYEVSSVSVPADPTVGVGRSNEATNLKITIRGIEMPQPNENPADGQRQNPAPTATPSPVVTGGADPITAERTRVADLIALGDRFNQRDLATQAISQGQSLDQFRALLLERQAPAAPLAAAAPKATDLPGFTQPASARSIGMTDEEIGKYSLIRAMNAFADGDWSKAGLEREVNIALADSLKKEARGFFVPHDILLSGLQRGMSKGVAGKGGELVETELRLDQFVDILRNKTVIARLGARMLGGLVGDLDLPKKVNGSNFYWLGEGENVTPSDFDLTTIPMTPKTIAGAIPVTRKLRKQAAKSVEAMIISDLIDGIAVAIDLAILSGSGTGAEPLGLLNQTGVPAITYPATGMDFINAVLMETTAAGYNVDEGALAYLTSIAQRGAAKTKQVFDGTGERVWNSANEVNGHKALATNQMPADKWVYGDFSQIVVGMWGVLDLKPDPYALAGSDGLMLRVFQDVDTAIRRKEAFCIGNKGV